MGYLNPASNNPAQKSIDQNVKKGVRKFMKTHKKKN